MWQLWAFVKMPLTRGTEFTHPDKNCVFLIPLNDKGGNMKARNHFKLTALLLSITILISVIPVSTSATTDNAAESLSTATENKTAQLDKFEQDCQIHKYVDASVLSSKTT